MSELSLTDTAEIVALIRDLAFLLLLVVALLVVVITYRKASAFLDSAKRTMKAAEDIVTTVADHVVKPAAASSGIAFGAGKAASFLFGLSRRRGRERNRERRRERRNDG